MKKASTYTSLALAAGLLLVCAPALADTRGTRDARDTNTTPVVVPIPVLTNPIVTPAHADGSISNHSSASANSGGNTGGAVTTGSQTSTVTVVNIGPTKQDTQVVTPVPQPNPAPACTGRTCPRTR